MALTDQQRKFVLEYPKDFNATQAAKRAGYSMKTAYSQGQRLLKHVEIQAALSSLTANALEAAAKSLEMEEISAKRVLQEVAHIAFFRIGDVLHVTEQGDPYIDLSDMDDGAKAALSQAEIEDFVDRREVDEEGKPVARDVRRVKIRAHDKLRANELLMKHLGLLNEKVEVEFKGDFAAALEASRRRAAASKKGAA